MSGPWKHEWKTVSKVWPSSKVAPLVVDKAEADAHVAMLVKHCEGLSKSVDQLKQLLKDAQGVAKVWMNLATKKQTNQIQYDVAAYSAALMEVALAGKMAHQNSDKLMAQLEAEGVAVGTEPASHALDSVKCHEAFYDEHGIKVGPTIEIEAPTFPMPYAPKEALPRWVPDVEVLAATKAAAAAEGTLADYVKWHEKMKAAQHEHGLTTMIYDEEADPPKAGTWIHYDAFFGTLTLHAEDSSGVCFEHWTTQCPNKTRAEEAANKLKQFLDEYNEHDAVAAFKEWWNEANGV